MTLTQKPSELSQLFAEAERYSITVIDKLVLEPESTVHLDPYVVRHAFEHRGFPQSWAWTPRMVMELRRDAHIIHFLFPNLTDSDRTVILALRDACHRLNVYKHGITDPTLLGFERWLATRQTSQCEEDFEQCKQALEEADIQRQLTTLQIELLETNFFDPQSDVKITMDNLWG